MARLFLVLLMLFIFSCKSTFIKDSYGFTSIDTSYSKGNYVAIYSPKIKKRPSIFAHSSRIFISLTSGYYYFQSNPLKLSSFQYPGTAITTSLGYMLASGSLAIMGNLKQRNVEYSDYSSWLIGYNQSNERKLVMLDHLSDSYYNRLVAIDPDKIHQFKIRDVNDLHSFYMINKDCIPSVMKWTPKLGQVIKL